MRPGCHGIDELATPKGTWAQKHIWQVRHNKLRRRFLKQCVETPARRPTLSRYKEDPR